MLELRHTYNLSLRGKNLRKMAAQQWKAFVNNVIREEAFTRPWIHCANNRKSSHLHCESFSRAEYIEKRQPNLARSYSRPERECLILKLTSKRNITLIFGVPSAKEQMKPLSICLHVIPVCSALQVYRAHI